MDEATILDRKLPFSLIAEQSLLGSILIDPECFNDLAELVSSEDFYLAEHKQIFLAMRELFDASREIDEVTLIDTLVHKGVYEKSGGEDYIRSLQSHIQMQEIRKQQGMKTSEISKHMIFTGNPGTGKTTIARLISRYMKAIGALSQGQLVEVTRADLVAQYVGQTAPLTMSVIKSAIGGVLFIDEAYSLYRGKDDSFGLECIDTIVKAILYRSRRAEFL